MRLVIFVNLQNMFLYAERAAGGRTMKVRGTLENFSFPPLVFCQVWFNEDLSPRMHMR